MANEQQSFQNHTKWDPPFHFFLAPVGLILLGLTIYEVVKNPGLSSGVQVLGMVWAIIAVFTIRTYSLKVQNRVIRLEERLRMERLCPEWPRIAELTVPQFIALRFASDAELPGLVEKALSGNLDQKQIKQSIQNWRPDHYRV
jgi:hypothetical protein